MISIIFSILSGVTIVLSRSVNGMLSKKMGAYQGTFYNYFTGFMTSLILMLVLMIVGVQHINISLDNEAGILNLKLDKFANIELKLKNATQNIDESLKEFVNELSNFPTADRFAIAQGQKMPHLHLARCALRHREHPQLRQSMRGQ